MVKALVTFIVLLLITLFAPLLNLHGGTENSKTVWSTGPDPVWRVDNISEQGSCGEGQIRIDGKCRDACFAGECGVGLTPTRIEKANGCYCLGENDCVDDEDCDFLSDCVRGQCREACLQGKCHPGYEAKWVEERQECYCISSN